MYEVVGCRECGELWIREGDAETATCPRCARRFQVSRLRTLGSADSAEGAREIRSNLLADRADYGGIVAGYTDLEEDRVIDDESYLTAVGLDVDEIAEAGEPEQGVGSVSDREIVLRAIDDVDTPSREQITAAVDEFGVGAETVEAILDRLRTAGEVTYDGNQYRRI